MEKRRKNLRLTGFDYSLPYTYYVTICSHDKRKLFLNKVINDLIIECLINTKEELSFDLFCYCLMPNHLHALITPNCSDGVYPHPTLSDFVRLFKGRTTAILRNLGNRERIWQRSFYDYVVRKSEDLNSIAEYILNNPLRKGLVNNKDDYQYSGLVDRCNGRE